MASVLWHFSFYPKSHGILFGPHFFLSFTVLIQMTLFVTFVNHVRENKKKQLTEQMGHLTSPALVANVTISRLDKSPYLKFLPFRTQQVFDKSMINTLKFIVLMK